MSKWIKKSTGTRLRPHVPPMSPFILRFKIGFSGVLWCCFNETSKRSKVLPTEVVTLTALNKLRRTVYFSLKYWCKQRGPKLNFWNWNSGSALTGSGKLNTELMKHSWSLLLFFAKLTKNGLAYGMGMAFQNKISIKAIQNAVFVIRNSILNDKKQHFEQNTVIKMHFLMTKRILNGTFWAAFGIQNTCKILVLVKFWMALPIFNDKIPLKCSYVVKNVNFAINLMTYLLFVTLQF